MVIIVEDFKKDIYKLHGLEAFEDKMTFYYDESGNCRKFKLTDTKVNDIEALKKLDYEGARAVLMKQHGIGKKVADCICVFGLHKLEAFPIDTHVRQILAEHYKAGFPFER